MKTLLLQKIKIYFENSHNIEKILHWIFILTLISIFIPINLSSNLNTHESIYTVSWIFYFFIPIPLFCLWVGIRYKRKGYKCKKNITLGIIYTILFIIYGSFCFWVVDFLQDDYTLVLKLEEKIKFDFPSQGNIKTDSLYNIKENDMTWKSKSLVYYSEEDTKILEENIKNSSLWIKKLNSFQKILEAPIVQHHQNHKEYYMIYIEELESYNEIPDESGTYTIDYLLYDATWKNVYIYKYTYDFIKNEDER